MDNLPDATAELPIVLNVLTVSTSQLDQLGRELQDAAQTILRHAKGDLGSSLSRDGAVSKAIVSVEHDWSKQRKAITDYLSAFGKGAQDAARFYAAVEHEIRSAAAPKAAAK